MNSYLKWAGGKSKLMPDLFLLFPKDMNNFIEPFTGSCAVPLYILDALDSEFVEGILEPYFITKDRKFIVNDSNGFLITCHLVVKLEFEKVTDRLVVIQKRFNDSLNKKKFYYLKRNLMNNFMKKRESLDHEETIEAAALFIFINKTCFNGIWRVNKSNEYNVPWNKVENVNIYDHKRLRRIAKLFQQISFYNEDFEPFVMNNTKKGDLVFLDPPYIPMSKTSSFTSYTSDGWTDIDNKRLSSLLDFIDKKKARFIMTNSNAEETKNLFGKWKINYIMAHRFIKPVKIGKRKKIKETVITNF